MAGYEDGAINDKQFVDVAEDVKKILTVVVRRRKVIPTKCMELSKDLATCEMIALENSKVVLKKSKEREKLKEAVQGLRKHRSFQFSLDDLFQAEKKLQSYYKKTKEVNIYLKEKKNLLNNFMER